MITQIPSSYANVVAPFAPLGRQPVGQESADLRMTSFKPLEQLAETAPGENRRSPDERPAEVDEQERLRQGRGQLASPVGTEDSRRQDEQERQQEEEQKVIRELAARDREVRAHEQSHAAVAGQHAGTPVYQYQRGPDGVSYAVGGEVPISTSPVPGDPEATLQKAQQIRRAASAPAEPSPQDRRVAAEAARMEMQARIEIQLRNAEEAKQQAEEAERERAIKEEEEAERRVAAELRREQVVEEENSQRNRAAAIDEVRNRNIDVTRRLIEIGVIPRPPSLGVSLNHHV
jgi:membrane protein involved in colicin uptake